MTDPTNLPQIIALAQKAHDNLLAQHKIFNEARIADARMAIQALLLINGGSATAVLIFAGNLATKTSSFQTIGIFSYCLGLFGIGVGLAGATALLAYFTNHAIAEEIVDHDMTYTPPFVHPNPTLPRKRRNAAWLHMSGMITAFSSLVAFVCGAITAAFGLSHMG